MSQERTSLKELPSDIEFLVNEDGVYIEIESFINFLRSDENVPEEYKSESKHLKNIASFLSHQLAEIILQKQLLGETFNMDKPN